MPIDTSGALTQFVGSLPTFIAVILAWMHSNGRFSDTNNRIGDTNSRLAKRIDDLRDLIRAESATIRAELRRVEDVMDARLKHLEERFN